MSEPTTPAAFPEKYPQPETQAQRGLAEENAETLARGLRSLRILVLALAFLAAGLAGLAGLAASWALEARRDAAAASHYSSAELAREAQWADQIETHGRLLELLGPEVVKLKERQVELLTRHGNHLTRHHGRRTR